MAASDSKSPVHSLTLAPRSNSVSLSFILPSCILRRSSISPTSFSSMAALRFTMPSICRCDGVASPEASMRSTGSAISVSGVRRSWLRSVKKASLASAASRSMRRLTRAVR